MATNEYYKAVKNTERLAEEAARTAQSSDRTIKSMAFTNRTIAFTNVTIQATQLAQLAQAQKTARVQQEQLALAHQEQGEARAHRFAMWRGTDEGKAFEAWQETSDGLIAVMMDRQNRWQAAWTTSIGRLIASVPENDRAEYSALQLRLRSSASNWKLAKRAALVLGIVAAAIIPIVLVKTAFDALISGLGGGANSIIGDVAGILFWLAASVAGFVMWGKASSRMKTLNFSVVGDPKHEARIATWGFDPLDLAAGFTVSRWYDNTGFDGYVTSLQQATQAAYTTFPSAKDLPALLLPEPLPPESQRFDELQSVLAEFSSEQKQLETS